MALHHEIGFWVAVAMVAVAAVVLFKIVAANVPWSPLQKLAAAA